jgi:hypothetical protein
MSLTIRLEIEERLCNVQGLELFGAKEYLCCCFRTSLLISFSLWHVFSARFEEDSKFVQCIINL